MNIRTSVLAPHAIGKVIARDGFKALSIKIGNAGLQLFLQIFLARLMGAAEFGAYMFAIAWVNILLIIGKLGFDMTALRFISSYNAVEDWSHLLGFINSSVRLVLATSLLVATFFALSTIIWSNQISHSQYEALLVGILLIPVLSLMQVQSAILRGLGSIIRSLTPFSIIRHALLIVLLACSYLYGADISALNAQVLTLVSGILALIVLLYWVSSAKNSIASKADVGTQPSYKVNTWLVTSIPMMVVAGFQVILGQADVIVVNIVIGPEEGGIYAAMSQLSLLMIMGQVSINAVVAPMIARFYAVGENQELQRVVKLTARLIFSVTLISGTFLVLFGTMIISLYGEGFEVGYPILVILVMAQLISAMAGSVSYLIAMTNHQNFLLWATGVSALFNLLLNLTLVPLYGAIAAATVTAITMACLNISLAYFANRRIGIRSTVFGL